MVWISVLYAYKANISYANHYIRGTSSLIRDLREEGYNFVLTAIFQSDPLESHFNEYRQMSGGK